MTIGKRIKQAREALRLSQQEVATHLSISRNSVAQWEIGASKPAHDKLVPLAKFLQVEVAWLMLDDSPAATGARKLESEDPHKKVRAIELIRIIRDAALELDDLQR